MASRISPGEAGDVDLAVGRPKFHFASRINGKLAGNRLIQQRADHDDL